MRRKKPPKKREPEFEEYMGFRCPGQDYPPRLVVFPRASVGATGGELPWDPDGSGGDPDEPEECRG